MVRSCDSTDLFDVVVDVDGIILVTNQIKSHLHITRTHTHFTNGKNLISIECCALFITFSLSFTYLFVSLVICTLVKCIAIDEIVLVIDNCSRILTYLLIFFFFFFVYVFHSLCIVFFLIWKIAAQHTILSEHWIA